MEYTFEQSRHNVHYLTAPYALLVKAFGNDGINARDDYKQMCQWDLATDHGDVEVYDYKIGTCYDPADGLEREQITSWHVQGDPQAIIEMLKKLEAAK